MTSIRPIADKVARFEDLVAWQKARRLAAEIYRVSGTGHFARDFGLRDQIRRAVVSILSNIAEGFERHGLTEFHRFLSIAKASCAEVRAQLYVAFDAQLIDDTTFQSLMQQATEVGRLIGGLRASVERRQKSS